MIRTQIYLHEDQYKRIKLISSRNNKPQSEIIRDALDKGISDLASRSVAQALLEMASTAVKTDDPNLSVNVDKYLYEEDDHS
jgi:predicted DNA-binding protein